MQTLRSSSTRFFFFFPFSSLFLDGMAKVFLSTFHQFFKSPSLDKPANYCAYVLKFRGCDHGMPCALEIDSTGGFKLGHVKSCPSTTKTIISPLPQSLWLANLAGW